MGFTSKQLQEEMLVQRIRAGDNSAFELLERYYRPFLLLYYKKIKNTIRTIDQDELFQLGRIGLNYAVKNYDKNSNTLFHSYAVLTITGQLNNYYRKNRKHFYGCDYNVISLDKRYGQQQMMLMDMVSDYGDDVVTSKVNAKLFLEEVYKILTTQKEKDVLIYRIQGYGYQEIADKMGISFKDVDNTIQKIRRKLRKMMQD